MGLSVSSNGLSVFLAVLASAPALAQTTVRVSVAPNGQDGNQNSRVSAISSDGRYVVFDSEASNLVLGDTGFFDDVFLRDMQAGVTVRLSVGPGGVQGNQSSWDPAMTPDARFVVFASGASNIVPIATPNWTNVLLLDRSTGQFERVSFAAGGGTPNSSAFEPAMSDDARFVTFASLATDIVLAPTNGTWQIYVHDRQLAQTELVSLTSSGAGGNGESRQPALSADGRWLAFESAASDLVPADVNGERDVFVRDLVLDQTTRASVGPGGVDASGASDSPSLSSDGQFLVFASFASNLVAGDTNGDPDVFVRDLAASQTVRVSVASGGAQASLGSGAPAISGNGRFVGFHSGAPNLVTPDTNHPITDVDTFVHDRVTGRTTRVNVSSSGAQANAGSTPWMALSHDGRFVSFGSVATNLAPVDLINIRSDVYLRDLRQPYFADADGDSYGGAASVVLDHIPPAGYVANAGDCDDGDAAVHPGAAEPLNGVDDDCDGTADDTFESYCTSSVTATACTPSISGSGLPSASATSGFVLRVDDLEAKRAGLFFYGLTPASVPWGNGNSTRCVSLPVQRTPVQNSGGTQDSCEGVFTLDWLAYMHAHGGALGQPIAPGQTFHAQAWFRDPPIAGNTNLSDALRFVLVP